MPFGPDGGDPGYRFADIGSSVYRSEISGGRRRITISEYLQDAPQEVVDDVLAFICHRSEGYRPELFEGYIASDAFILSKRPVFLSRGRRFKLSSEGSFRSLSDSVQRLVDSGLLSESDIENTYITWSKRRAVRLLGVCCAMFRVISISPALDSADVPEECLDFVVYHEFLHIRNGVFMGERSHDSKFRKQERLFPDYERVVRELGRLRRYGHPDIPLGR